MRGRGGVCAAGAECLCAVGKECLCAGGAESVCGRGGVRVCGGGVESVCVGGAKSVWESEVVSLKALVLVSGPQRKEVFFTASLSPDH